MTYILGVDSKPSLEEAVIHYGVKGMKWGVRRSKVEREAYKDAKEFVEAKAYYGKGAGTRRKLIKAQVEGKSKKLEGYKEAFDKAVSEQDTAKAADKAVKTRKRTDRKETTAKTGKAFARRVTGQAGNAAALVTIASVGYTYVRNNPEMVAALKKTVSSL